MKNTTALWSAYLASKARILFTAARRRYRELRSLTQDIEARDRESDIFQNYVSGESK